jgi:hypothetical protein
MTPETVPVVPSRENWYINSKAFAEWFEFARSPMILRWLWAQCELIRVRDILARRETEYKAPHIQQTPEFCRSMFDLIQTGQLTQTMIQGKGDMAGERKDWLDHHLHTIGSLVGMAKNSQDDFPDWHREYEEWCANPKEQFWHNVEGYIEEFKRQYPHAPSEAEIRAMFVPSWQIDVSESNDSAGGEK